MAEVSIIIPVHNGELFLGECLESVLKQSFRSIEIVCVNDGSSDGSRSILEAYASKDSRITVINLDHNVGPGPARNKGVDVAAGRYCAFCDADDRYPLRAIETLYLAAEASAAPVSGGNIAFMDHTMSRFVSTGDKVACTQFLEKDTVFPREFQPLWLPVYHQRYLMATHFLKTHAIRYPALLRGEDPPFLAHVFCAAEKVSVVPDIIYLYRIPAPGVQKFFLPRAYADYVSHIALTYTTYKKYEDKRGACFFLANAMEDMFNCQNWLSYSRAQKRLLVNHILPLVNDAGSQLFKLDYKPYPVDGKNVEEIFNLIKEGILKYSLINIKRKLWRQFRKKAL